MEIKMKGGAIMKEYAIYQLKDKEYDGFLLCLTYESILNYLKSIESEAMISESKGVLLVDQLLTTGDGRNRFLVCPFDHGVLNVDAAENVCPKEYYKRLSIQLLRQNYTWLQNSILTDQQRNEVWEETAF